MDALLSEGSGQVFMTFLVLLSQVRGVKGVFLANQKTNGKVVTLITYNKGRDWDRLRPPSTDMNGKPTNCEPVSPSPVPHPPQGGHKSSLKGLWASRGGTRSRDGNHGLLWALRRGARGAPCFTGGLAGGRRGKMHQSALSATRLRNKRPATILHSSAPGWAQPRALCTLAGRPHKCGGWLISGVVCSLYLASSSRDRPRHTLMAVAKVQESEQTPAE